MSLIMFLFCRRGSVCLTGDDGSRVLHEGEVAGHSVHVVFTGPNVSLTLKNMYFSCRTSGFFSSIMVKTV